MAPNLQTAAQQRLAAGVGELHIMDTKPDYTAQHWKAECERLTRIVHDQREQMKKLDEGAIITVLKKLYASSLLVEGLVHFAELRQPPTASRTAGREWRAAIFGVAALLARLKTGKHG